MAQSAWPKTVKGPSGERAIVGDVEIVWGIAARWKAELRNDSLRRHLEQPIAARLQSALSLVLRRSDRERQSA